MSYIHMDTRFKTEQANNASQLLAQILAPEKTFTNTIHKNGNKNTNNLPVSLSANAKEQMMNGLTGNKTIFLA